MSTERLDITLQIVNNNNNLLSLIRLFLSALYTGVKKNLHIALIMDCSSDQFTVHCESNPALYKQCTILWKEYWSSDAMAEVYKTYT